MQTLGQYRVSSSNPDNNTDVAAITNVAAQWIEYLEQFAQKDGIPNEAKRLVAIAQTRVEEAAMWSAKAFTKGPRT